MPVDITKFTSHDADGELMKRLNTYTQLKKELEEATKVGGGVPTEAQQNKIDEVDDKIKNLEKKSNKDNSDEEEIKKNNRNKKNASKELAKEKW